MDGRATDRQLQGAERQAWNQASARQLRPDSNEVTAGGAQPDRYGSDPDKALVMRVIAFLVRDGCAELAVLESGDMKLRLTTGEVFHFGEDAVMRVA
jgi:hypothetical protein